jgi:hypothetical protein
MRLVLATLVGLAAIIGASTTPVLAAAAPGPAANSAIPSTSQVEKVHRRWGRGGGFGIYIGPRWGGYYGGYPYYDDYGYGRSYAYYPRYRHRRWHRHRHHHRHHHRRYRHHHRH